MCNFRRPHLCNFPWPPTVDDDDVGGTVSIHAPAWGATYVSVGSNTLRKFQSTPPRGGRHGCQNLFDSLYVFQSTPPRGGRLGPQLRHQTDNDVSIHAPAWGATRFQVVIPGRQGFQSTPPRGGRLPAYANGDTQHPVSIHAPAWGATPAHRRPVRQHRGFNPRPRVGGDLSGRTLTIVQGCFNPRPRVGGDSG